MLLGTSMPANTPGDPVTARPDEPRDPRNILRLRRCPKCDYDLAGLPRRHRCPECGFEYDESMFVLYATSSSAWADLFTGSWGTRMFRLACFAFFLYYFGSRIFENILLFWKSGSVIHGLIAFVYAGGIVALLLSVLRYRKARREHGGDTQLGFSSQGAWKTTKKGGVGPPDVIPWDCFRKIRIRRLSKGVWRLQLTGPLLRGYLVDGFIECTRREAALIRNEIRRRLRAAKR